MKMSLVVEGLRSDVISVAELGDETVAEVAERIADLIGRSVPTRILDLLSDVAAELTAELPEGHVEIRVAGDDVELSYEADEPLADAESVSGGGGRADGGAGTDGDPSARISLRLSEALKTRVEEGAARDGISVNAYIVRTLERGVSQSGSGSWSSSRSWSAASGRSGRSGRGNRLRGFGST